MTFNGGLNAFKKGHQEAGDDLKAIWAEKDRLILEIKVLIPDLKYKKLVKCLCCGVETDKTIELNLNTIGCNPPTELEKILEEVKNYKKREKKTKKS